MVYNFVIAPSTYEKLGRPKTKFATLEKAMVAAETALRPHFPIIKREHEGTVMYSNEAGGVLIEIRPFSA